MMPALMGQAGDARREGSHLLERGGIESLGDARILARFVLVGLLDHSELAFAVATGQFARTAVLFPGLPQRHKDPVSAYVETTRTGGALVGKAVTLMLLGLL